MKEKAVEYFDEDWKVVAVVPLSRRRQLKCKHDWRRRVNRIANWGTVCRIKNLTAAGKIPWKKIGINQFQADPFLLEKHLDQREGPWYTLKYLGNPIEGEIRSLFDLVNNFEVEDQTRPIHQLLDSWENGDQEAT